MYLSGNFFANKIKPRKVVIDDLGSTKRTGAWALIRAVPFPCLWHKNEKNKRRPNRCCNRGYLHYYLCSEISLDLYKATRTQRRVSGFRNNSAEEWRSFINFPTVAHLLSKSDCDRPIATGRPERDVFLPNSHGQTV